MIQLNKAIGIAKSLYPAINHCTEHSDAFVFSDSKSNDIGGNGPVVVMKEDGAALDMSFYIDNSNGTFIREYDILDSDQITVCGGMKFSCPEHPEN